MNEEKELAVSSSLKRFDVMRLLDFLPRTLWVEEADSLLCHVLSKQISEETTT